MKNEPLTYLCEVCGEIHELETGCEFEDDGDDLDVDAIVAAFVAVDKLPPEEREAAFNRAMGSFSGDEMDASAAQDEKRQADSPALEALRVLAGYVRCH